MENAIKKLLRKLSVTLNDLDILHLTEYLKREEKMQHDATLAAKGEIVFNSLNGL